MIWRSAPHKPQWPVARMARQPLLGGGRNQKRRWASAQYLTLRGGGAWWKLAHFYPSERPLLATDLAIGLSQCGNGTCSSQQQRCARRSAQLRFYHAANFSKIELACVFGFQNPMTFPISRIEFAPDGSDGIGNRLFTSCALNCRGKNSSTMTISARSFSANSSRPPSS